MRHLLTFAAVLSLASTLSACKDNPTDNTSKELSGPPRTGSSYDFAFYTDDLTTPDRTFKLVAGPSRITYYGKPNVVVFDLVPNALLADSLSFAYSSNGDFETPFVQGYQFDTVMFYTSGWTAMGTTNTGTNRTLVTYDTSAVIDGVPTTFSFRRVGSYVGTETMQVGGKALNVHKSVYAQTTAIRGGITTFDAAQVDTVWYAPSIGMLTRWASVQETEDAFGKDVSGQTWVLKGWALK